MLQGNQLLTEDTASPDTKGLVNKIGIKKEKEHPPPRVQALHASLAGPMSTPAHIPYTPW